MQRHARPAAAATFRCIVYAVLAGAIATVVGACGGASSGGAKNAGPGATLAAALQLQQQGKLNEAKQLYLQVIKAQPKNYYAQYDLGVIAQTAGDNGGALSYYGAALTANPKYVPALYNEATIYATSDPTLAISTYRQVIALQPVAPTAELNLGLLEVKHGAPHKGVNDLAVAITQDPSLLAKVPKHLRTLVQTVASSATSSPSPSTSSDPSASTSTSP